VNRRKRKRKEEAESPKHWPIESDEEWGGIQNVSQSDPQVIEFKETKNTETLNTKSNKFFMVTSMVLLVCQLSVF